MNQNQEYDSSETADRAAHASPGGRSRRDVVRGIGGLAALGFAGMTVGASPAMAAPPAVALGDTVGGVADVMAYLDGTTVHVITADATVISTTNQGQAIQMAFDVADQIAVSREQPGMGTGADPDRSMGRGFASLKIAPGVYDLSDVVSIDLERPNLYVNNRRQILGLPLLEGGSLRTVAVDAYGAIFNRPLVNISYAFSLRGLEVRGTNADGFHFASTQHNSNHHDLFSHYNQGSGFSFGDAENTAIAWSYFSGLKAVGNGGHGFKMHAHRDVQISWVNANVFDGCMSRENGGNGFHLEGSVHYNSFLGAHAEANGGDYGIYLGNVTDASGNARIGCTDNSFQGGHVLGAVNSIYADSGNHNVVVGGRFPSGVRSASKNHLWGFATDTSPLVNGQPTDTHPAVGVFVNLPFVMMESPQ